MRLQEVLDGNEKVRIRATGCRVHKVQPALEAAVAVVDNLLLALLYSARKKTELPSLEKNAARPRRTRLLSLCESKSHNNGAVILCKNTRSPLFSFSKCDEYVFSEGSSKILFLMKTQRLAGFAQACKIAPKTAELVSKIRGHDTEVNHK